MFSTNRIHRHTPLQPTVRQAALLRTFFPRPGQMAKPLSALLGIALACGCASILAIAGESRCPAVLAPTMVAIDTRPAMGIHSETEKWVSNLGFRLQVSGAVCRLVAGEKALDCRSFAMSKDKSSGSDPGRWSQAKKRQVTVRLNLLVLDPDRFCHRLEKANIPGLARSLAAEGQGTPLKFFTDAKGKKVLLGGYRRYDALQWNIEHGVPGFTPDMEVDAIEILEATPQDLVAISITDNQREDLTPFERILVAGKLNKAGMSDERAATALGVKIKTYRRDVTVALHEWMCKLIQDNCIPPTTAYTLLVEAQKVDRTTELKEYLEGWVAAKKEFIEEKERDRIERTGKGLRPPERAVTYYLTKPVASHWVHSLCKKEPLNEDTSRSFLAGIDNETGELKIKSLSLNLTRASVAEAAMVYATLCKVTKVMGPIVKMLYEVKGKQGSPGPQGPEGPQGTVGNLSFDADALRELGMDALAKQLEQEAASSGEDPLDPSAEDDSDKDEGAK